MSRKEQKLEVITIIFRWLKKISPSSHFSLTSLAIVPTGIVPVLFTFGRFGLNKRLVAIIDSSMYEYTTVHVYVPTTMVCIVVIFYPLLSIFRESVSAISMPCS